ncbi:MAG: YwiC-like family protein [Acidobacteria bacterium]|nr:YwiC-like family protein [Acidobacteriota bacterium]
MSRLLIPREHGAWGMVALPFIVGALMSGGWANLRTLAAALAVLSLFMLRTPLLAIWRHRAAIRKAAREQRPAARNERTELRDAHFSSVVYMSVAFAFGLYLLLTLPVAPLLWMAFAAAVLTAAILYLAVRNYQRYPALQIVSAFGLTASCLPAYLAVHGRLDTVALWVWLLCAIDSSASVLVVHARLEAIVASRKRTTSSLPHRRNALLAQAGLWSFLLLLAAQGRSWLLLPFLPTSALHIWDMWQLGRMPTARVSMQRVGIMQLAASIAFCSILIAVLRLSLV